MCCRDFDKRPFVLLTAECCFRRTPIFPIDACSKEAFFWHAATCGFFSYKLYSLGATPFLHLSYMLHNFPHSLPIPNKLLASSPLQKKEKRTLTDLIIPLFPTSFYPPASGPQGPRVSHANFPALSAFHPSNPSTLSLRPHRFTYTT